MIGTRNNDGNYSVKESWSRVRHFLYLLRNHMLRSIIQKFSLPDNFESANCMCKLITLIAHIL